MQQRGDFRQAESALPMQCRCDGAKLSDMSSEILDTLKALAAKYIWWKTPDEAIATPDRVIAQVMDIGGYKDVQALASQVGDDILRQVLARAEPGIFRDRSWAYWHYRLGLATLHTLPPPPIRRFA
jgi:hypothetical protein